MNTKKLKQLVLDLAIHGKLVPQDPNDEPASELLKRIKEEKAKSDKGKKTSISSDNLDEVPFEVPSGWGWCRLSDITERIEDCLHSTAPNEGKGYPLIRTSNIGEGHLIFEGVHRVSKDVYDQRNVRVVPQKNDLIYAREAPAGNVAVIGDELVCLGQRTVLIRPFSKYIESYLLAYFILSPYSRNALVSQSKGSTSQHVNLEKIRPFEIPLPPLSEQKRIVSAIEKWFAVIDQIESNEADLRKSIEQTKKKVLDLAIHGKLVEQDDNDEPASELLAEIRKEKEKLVKEGKLKKKDLEVKPIEEDEVPFEIPERWMWCRWGDLSFSIQYGFNAPAQSSGTIKMVRISDIHDNKVSWDSVPYCEIKDLEIETYKLQVNDILFARTGGTVGKSFLVTEINEDAVYAGYLIRTRFSKNIFPKYAKIFMETATYWEQLREGTIATAQPNCNGQTLSKMMIPIPPLSEQKRIVAKVEEVMGELDKIVEMMG